MTAYRSNAATPKPTTALVVRGKRAIVMTIFLGLFAVVPSLFMSLDSIECVREGDGPEGVCRVRERGLLRWGTRDIPLRDLKALRTDEHTDSDSDTLSRLVLVTTAGEVPLGRSSDNIEVSARRKAVAGFDDFQQRRAPRFDVTVGYNGLIFSAIWTLVCVLMIGAKSGRTVRVVVDPANGAIRVRRWFRTIALPLSRDVRVVSEKDSEGDDNWFLVSPTQRIPLPQNVRLEDVTAFEAARDVALDPENRA